MTASGLPGWLKWAALGLAVLIGIWLRIRLYGQSLVGDELSTLWIVQNHGLGGTIDYVRGDGEITPPLFFILADLSRRLGSAPELVRLPSLVAGLASLPLYFLIGRRLFDSRVGLVATGIASISPILVYFSANGRAYSVMLLMLLLSTWSMLVAADTGRKRWWALYAVASCLAMYSHYTAAFVLAAQLLWLLWARPPARLAALASNAVVAVLFLPWLPGFFDDSGSPTTPVLEALQGHGFEAKRTAVEQLLFWQIKGGNWGMSGRWDAALIVAGMLVALVAIGVKLTRSGGLGKRLREIDRGLVLVLLLVLATPVGALILGTFSTDIFGGRNLGASWTGLPLLTGALVVAAGPVWGTVSLVAVTAGLLGGSIRLTDAGRTEFPYRDVAAYVDQRAEPGDVVVDSSHITPVPLTPLDAYLDFSGREYRLNLPEGDPPFLPTTPIPDTGKLIRQAFRGTDRVFMVTLIGQESLVEQDALSINGQLYPLPAGWSVTSQESFDGIYPLTVTVVERDREQRPPRGENADDTD